MSDSDIRHPLLGRLLELWVAKRDGRRMPARTDFDVLELRDWLGNLMLIEVIDGGAEFRYRVYGSTLAANYGRDLTGKTTEVIRPEIRETVRHEYRRVCAERSPMVVERERAVRYSRKIVAKLILPLSADGEQVNMLLVAAYPT